MAERLLRLLLAHLEAGADEPDGPERDLGRKAIETRPVVDGIGIGTDILVPKGTLAERLLRLGVVEVERQLEELWVRPERDLGRKAIETRASPPSPASRSSLVPKGTLAERLLRLLGALGLRGLRGLGPERDLGRKAIETRSTRGCPSRS